MKKYFVLMLLLISARMNAQFRIGDTVYFINDCINLIKEVDKKFYNDKDKWIIDHVGRSTATAHPINDTSYHFDFSPNSPDCCLSQLQKRIFDSLLLVQAPERENKHTSTDLNLRTEPNASSKVLAVIPKGTEVRTAENCDCKWIQVQYGGNIGYVYSKYLTNNKIVNTNISYLKTSNTSVKYYTNSFGERVQSPTYYKTVPAGATALCRDGTYSFSRNSRGTCSHHGGVAKWLK